MKRFQLNGKYEYCPNGNYWYEVSGIFDEKIYLFCDCKKCGGKVYQLKPIDYTRKVGKEKIEKFRQRQEIEEVADKINSKNYLQVKKLLDTLPTN